MLTAVYAPDGLGGTIPAPIHRQPASDTWDAIQPETLARLRLQSRFRTGLDIARHTAALLRRDILAPDTDAALYKQPLPAWDGFAAQQFGIAMKRPGARHAQRYLHVAGWMVPALHHAFGMRNEDLPALVAELFARLKAADANELGAAFAAIDDARAAGDHDAVTHHLAAVQRHGSRVVPVIAELPAHARDAFELAKRTIEAGACALQINRRCGSADPSLVDTIRAARYAFLELGVEDGIVIVRTEAFGADPVGSTPHDDDEDGTANPYSDEHADQDCSGLDYIGSPQRTRATDADSEAARCLRDSPAWLQNGADLLWFETTHPCVEQIAPISDAVRATMSDARLFFNTSPPFNWTLSFRQQVFDRWKSEGRDVSAYERRSLAHPRFDGSALAEDAERSIRAFQAETAKRMACSAD